jgi:hypothetical protein
MFTVIFSRTSMEESSCTVTEEENKSIFSSPPEERGAIRGESNTSNPAKHLT